MPRPRYTADRTLSNAEKQKAYRERQKQARTLELQQKGMPASSPIPTMPAAPRWKALLEAARANMETARDEMQAYFDDRSEEWQEGDRGQAMQERIEQLETALDALDVG
jgi:hypothetical protein